MVAVCAARSTATRYLYTRKKNFISGTTANYSNDYNIIYMPIHSHGNVKYDFKIQTGAHFHRVCA